MTSKKLLAALFAASLTLSGAGVAMAQDKPKDTPKEEHKQDKDHKKDEKKAAATAKIGETAPAFTLTDTAGKTINLADFKGKIVVLEWFNPDCPIVKGHYEKGTFTKLKNDFKDKGVVFLAINSGAPGQQGNGTARNSDAKTAWKIENPILLDESGTVGRAYGAKTTPHMFVINKDGKLVYAGAIDDKKDTNYVTNALNEVLANKPVTKAETEAYGCPVKFATKETKENKKGG